MMTANMLVSLRDAAVDDLRNAAAWKLEARPLRPDMRDVLLSLRRAATFPVPKFSPSLFKTMSPYRELRDLVSGYIVLHALEAATDFACSH